MCCDAPPPAVSRTSSPVARRDHKCCECGEVVPAGSAYELVEGLWEGRWDHFRTCPRCATVRELAEAYAWATGKCAPCFGELVSWLYEGDWMEQQEDADDVAVAMDVAARRLRDATRVMVA